MGKVVKFCTACDEGFAERFGFCPNCGAQLQAFELNPVAAAVPKAETSAPVSVPVEPVRAAEPDLPAQVVPLAEIEAEGEDDNILEFDAPIDAAPADNKTAEAVTPVVVAETPKVAEPVVEAKQLESFTEAVEARNDYVTAQSIDSSVLEDKVETPPVVPNVPAPAIAAPEVVAPTTKLRVEDLPQRQGSVQSSTVKPTEDLAYSPTIVYDTNVGQRNKLLLGAFALSIVTLTGSYIYSMFNKMLDISAIETPQLVSFVGEVEPVPMEVEPPPKINDEKGGGGGGGGKEEQTEASQGRVATQTEKPLVPPSSQMDRVTDPEIAIRAATEGRNKAPQTDENYGVPTGLAGRSDGSGSGGGLGSGRGTGQGGGIGTGQGNGIGSGSGNGNGNGNGDGLGDGDGPTVKVKPPPPAGPTTQVKILSKPQARYTDAARQQGLQGKVVLRVTFSANGSIGAISVVSGLGGGLTEQAIAAAKAIRFEPAMKAGQPYAVTRSIEYSFTIY